MKSITKFLSCLLILATVFSLCSCAKQEDSQATGSTGATTAPTGTQPTEPQIPTITIQEAIDLAKAAGETPTTETYTISGTVKQVINPKYGEMIVEDETGELYIYGSMAPDGTYYDQMTDKPMKGDKITLTGVLMTYNEEPQMGAKDQKAVIVDWTHVDVPVDTEGYSAMSIQDARNAAKGTQVKVSGVVAAIAYANGQIPCGVILVDNTASIYVYGDIAMNVSVGNKVEIIATKTYWILEKEQSNAALYGYQGACQLEAATLVSNDKGSHEFDKSWIKETTVKKLLNTSFDQNITSQIVKVTALVQKKPGNGFTNYYFYDLDGTTGSYTYTQCNGSDFAWLDAFDGKICTVYLTAINAKSAPAECFYRLMPIAVEPISNFAYPADKVPAFAIEYGIIDLFQSTYGANPQLALPSTYSNSLLNISGVQISYSSSNTAIGQIDRTSVGEVLNLVKAGTCEITITATYQGYTATAKVKVTCETSQQITTPTVAEIIAKADGTKVQIRGIVISSLVNRDGFYIGDETGMIAVLTSADVLSQVQPGDEVVLEGYKVHFKKDSTTGCIGQCAIVGSLEKTSDTKLIANYYGNHKYPTGYAISGKTIDELYGLDAMTDYTNHIYTVKAKIVIEGNQYYSNILLMDENGTNKLRLYCSNSNQYSWLAAYEGQVVELELALCNWNDKNYYTGCVISATVDGVKTINDLNFRN